MFLCDQSRISRSFLNAKSCALCLEFIQDSFSLITDNLTTGPNFCYTDNAGMVNQLNIGL